ncbi:hypothetical protein IEQ34_010332 [Dendrobium chrysotoxum]|uniref:BZIP domain-containing protein n=1 Tax=Dendrobium chrysotoxum TaxID=161865 RepID=A0AAV7H399_DENCH|nr:hypothetical protein IEQ34_010332 [Dendrobium chrysotoxum]
MIEDQHPKIIKQPRFLPLHHSPPPSTARISPSPFLSYRANSHVFTSGRPPPSATTGDKTRHASPSIYYFFLPTDFRRFCLVLSTEDSDEDLFTVPDVESAPGNSSPAAIEAGKVSGEGPSKSRKGRNPAEREYRRLKRLLRNRVSAQQARERKKVYLNDLESTATHLQEQNMKLEEKISTLVNENTMLRKVLMNARPKIDDSGEHNEKTGNF